jgi:predicted DsbA family dithiol-disulfide isomerase
VQVEIWADIICPWCGLGSYRLEKAVNRFGRPVEVVHRSFQLDPSWPEGETASVSDMLQSSKGLSPEQVRTVTARVEALAHEEGLTPYHVYENRVGNTGLAHELLAYATEQGHHAEGWKAMFRAYFGEARSVFDRDSVMEVGVGSLGLDAEGVTEALGSRKFRKAVFEDQIEARRLGARGVPFAVIDRAYGISGAQPVEQFEAALERAWTERQSAAAGGD